VRPAVWISCRRAYAAFERITGSSAESCVAILYPRILEQRKIVAVLYACIWGAIASVLVLGFTGPHDGLLP
jgi:hypothetical protein